MYQAPKPEHEVCNLTQPQPDADAAVSSHSDLVRGGVCRLCEGPSAVLGSGSFGRVVKGVLNGTTVSA